MVYSRCISRYVSALVATVSKCLYCRCQAKDLLLLYILKRQNRRRSLNQFINANIISSICLQVIVFFAGTPKTVVPKSQEKRATEGFPKISLKFNPQSNQLYLQVNDEILGAGNSNFCSICNAPQCKLTSGRSTEKVPSESKSNTITISVDREAFCQAICNGSAEASSKSSTATSENSDVGNDYCPHCDAAKCKLTEQLPDDPSSTEKGVEPSKEIMKGSGYCDVCKADKCKLEQNLSEKPDTKGASSDIKNINNPNADEYCKECDAPKCKLIETLAASPNSNEPDKRGERSPGSKVDVEKGTQYCEKCDAPVCKLKTKSSDTGKKSDRNNNSNKSSHDSGSKHSNDGATDITKTPGYCIACKLPKCKFETSGTVTQTGDVNSTSNSSDKIIITVNASEICGIICNKDATSNQLSTTQNIKPGKNESDKIKSRKGTRVNTSYEKDNS